MPGGTPQTQTVTVGYDAKGNITSRSDVGSYTYGASNSTCGSVPGASLMAGAHAVTSIAGAKNATYCYDHNGNLVAGDGRTVTWTAYDMVASVSRGAASVSFDYGPDRARFRRTDVTSQGTTTTTYVGGKAMEEIAHPNGSIERKHTIGDFAVVTTTASSSATTYLHRDHLGSVDVVTSATGAVLQRMSFDAWGKRREISSCRDREIRHPLRHALNEFRDLNDTSQVYVSIVIQIEKSASSPGRSECSGLLDHHTGCR